MCPMVWRVSSRWNEGAPRSAAAIKRLQCLCAYLLATAGMFVIIHSALTIGTRAQNIENGVGVICDSPQQVEQVIILRSDFKSAVEEINAQNNSPVCEILNIAFLVGGVISEASNDKGTWQIRKILIVGLYLGSIMSSVQPTRSTRRF
jgi:hypothetical protein